MSPDFAKSVIEALAKRAASVCSNIECRVTTSGPAEDPTKAINIGEAAHIYGAKQGAARFRSDMTDTSRAEITNGIWLCRNCHKRVDSDPKRYPAEILFEWRAAHERYIISKTGTQNDAIRFDLETREIDKFREDTALAKQIVRDKPPGWEYRLTAELLRSYLKPAARRWSDLQRGLYSKTTTIIESVNASAWLGAKCGEASRLARALSALYSQELSKTWGPPGEPGDPLEIRHVCALIAAAADQILTWEEAVRFVSTDHRYTRIFEAFPGALGLQFDELMRVPKSLDEAVDWADAHPGVNRHFNFELTFKLPDGWLEKLQCELEAAVR